MDQDPMDQDPMDLKKFSKVLITGSTSKLGACLAESFAKKNIPLLLTGRNTKILEKLKDDLSSHTHVEVFSLDLSRKEHLSRLLNLIDKHSPDLVINSAGIGLYGSVLSHKLEEHLEILNLNCNALFAISYEAARVLKRDHKRGMIVNISSVADIFPYPYFSTYSSSKAFVTNFSLSFDEELKQYGIRVLTSVPGPIATDFRIHASKGSFTSMKGAISPEEAAYEIEEQIRREKKLHIFPKKIRFGRAFLRYLFPKFMMYALLKRKIQNRFK
ncbi:hypothetical protein COB11_01795 [Candidatus Aerophobetes bacterium]|uniref:SDR family NAD(P)-dependent oxidoreductase n=1 Tax=Aerophobetes bacterium TaxID=2030807 RepID=A0A2A4YL89_UNCAE|nr:MAG: hypothetical protein COB11_01795 [Candidatus Aerophobetes bacterium]